MEYAPVQMGLSKADAREILKKIHYDTVQSQLGMLATLSQASLVVEMRFPCLDSISRTISRLEQQIVHILEAMRETADKAGEFYVT
jgi:hypothetical protein